MKRILFGIFAHPDDEAFGPSGTLILEVERGTDVHLLCMTRGEKGINADKYEDLGRIREAEWRKAGSLLGVRSLIMFGYPDGSLCNNLYHEIAAKIESQVKEVLKSYSLPYEVHFLTYDTTGVSGHLDHVAVSLITTFVYCRLKSLDDMGGRIGDLRYFCLPYNPQLVNNTDYVYMPCGRTAQHCDESVDISKVFEKKLQVMLTHHTQQHDSEWMLKAFGDALKTERYLLNPFVEKP